jgi:hypothetical protein
VEDDALVHPQRSGGPAVFIVSILLFVGGMFVLGISFSLAELQALVFVVGVLMVVVGLAIPLHLGSATRRDTWNS